MTTLQQQMATKAHELVSGVGQDEKQKYGTMAHKLPVLIHTAGLAQALAFVEARQDPAQLKLLDHLAATLGIEAITNRQQLAQKSREESLPVYMLLTRRALQALVWYKRFAESILNVDARADAEAVAAEQGQV
jgi:CRISPR-associated protein Cmr5